MIKKQQTHPLAILDGRPTVVSAHACRNTHTATSDDALSTSVSVEQRSATCYILQGVQRTAASGRTTHPSAAIKSP
jgi:hypothetical protein